MSPIASLISNWTFISLNLPIQEDFKTQQNLKAVDKISVRQGMIQAKVGMLWCTGRF